MIPGILPVQPGRGTFTFEFLAGYNPTLTAAQTMTVTNVNFGPEDSNRWIFIGIGYETDERIETMTIGGTQAFAAVHGENTLDSDQNADIWYAYKPTGTSGSVVVTFSAHPGTSGIGLAVYRLTNVGHPVYDNDGLIGNFGGTTSRSNTVTIPAGGVGLWGFSDNNQAATISWTGTGVVEDTDFVDSGNAGRVSNAHSLSTGAITATATGTSQQVQGICGVSIQPMPELGSPGSFIFDGTNEWLVMQTNSVNPNRRTFTVSLWFRWTTLPGAATDSLLTFESRANPSTDFLDFNAVDLVADEYFHVVENDASVTVMNVRAPDQNFLATTWYHLVWAIDTTQATAADRVKLYLNGTDITETISTQIALNAETWFMAPNYNMSVGGTIDGVQLFTGRVAFIQIVDGLQLAGTDFGQDDAGTWKHKRYTGNFGPNGCYWNGQLGFIDLIRGRLLESGAAHNQVAMATTSAMLVTDNIDTVILPPYLTL